MAVLILLIAIRLFELLAPAGFGIMCLLLFYFLIYSFYFLPSHCLLLLFCYRLISLLFIVIFCMCSLVSSLIILSFF